MNIREASDETKEAVRATVREYFRRVAFGVLGVIRKEFPLADVEDAAKVVGWAMATMAEETERKRSDS